MWGYLAAAALPYVVGALQKKPSRPGAPAPVVLPDRSQYINEILQSGYNTNSAMYDQASAQVQENVNRALARQGLVGSSVGAQAMIEGQNKVQQSFLDEKMRRQQEAFRVVHGIDMDAAKIQAGNAQSSYEAAMAEYKDKLARQAAVAQGIGQLANVGMQAYGADQASTAYDRRRNEDRAWMTSMYGGAPAQAAAPSVNVMSPYSGTVGYPSGGFYGYSSARPSYPGTF